MGEGHWFLYGAETKRCPRFGPPATDTQLPLAHMCQGAGLTEWLIISVTRQETITEKTGFQRFIREKIRNKYAHIVN